MRETMFDPPILLNRGALPQLPTSITTRREAAPFLRCFRHAERIRRRWPSACEITRLATTPASMVRLEHQSVTTNGPAFWPLTPL